uniref:Uncharacterized protein n=1 Tax=Trichobilharzia regenti TaxID=157069 RepID=A0AA85J6V2_TRIRE|nr:unnamed protein product [Trichobilharzia regenti]
MKPVGNQTKHLTINLMLTSNWLALHRKLHRVLRVDHGLISVREPLKTSTGVLDSCFTSLGWESSVVHIRPTARVRTQDLSVTRKAGSYNIQPLGPDSPMASS